MKYAGEHSPIVPDRPPAVSVATKPAAAAEVVVLRVHSQHPLPPPPVLSLAQLRTPRMQLYSSSRGFLHTAHRRARAHARTCAHVRNHDDGGHSRRLLRLPLKYSSSTRHRRLLRLRHRRRGSV
jgi:hypothetical protein